MSLVAKDLSATINPIPDKIHVSTILNGLLPSWDSVYTLLNCLNKDLGINSPPNLALGEKGKRKGNALVPWLRKKRKGEPREKARKKTRTSNQKSTTRVVPKATGRWNQPMEIELNLSKAMINGTIHEQLVYWFGWKSTCLFVSHEHILWKLIISYLVRTGYTWGITPTKITSVEIMRLSRTVIFLFSQMYNMSLYYEKPSFKVSLDEKGYDKNSHPLK